jgi:exodeoxyribonuclease-1
MMQTFYWHDYETWGADPKRDRPAQFGGLRTDAELEPIGEPLVIYSRPSDDMLPQPEACMVTGISPQLAYAKGVPEAEFIAQIHRELAQPGTCGVGYNSIRFDDEFTRFTLYRNLFDPYAREWQNGNSRWDIIDMVRLTHALRPEGIEWPSDAAGRPSFRLELLTAANGIAHQAAHDALSDVYATIALARLIKQRQPRLYGYLLSHRNKHQLRDLLNLKATAPILLHVSSMYPVELGCIAPVVALAQHPTNSNGVIVFDLRQDSAPLLELDDEQIHQRLFTPTAALPEGVERIPLKTVHLNKCPVLVPTNTLTAEAAERWQINLEQAERHRQQLLSAPELQAKISRVHQMKQFEPQTDPDLSLYSGPFFSEDDRRRMQQIRETPVDQLAGLHFAFDDARLPEMLFRYRARNWPETLNETERQRWDEYRQTRLFDVDGGGAIQLDEYLAQLDLLAADEGLSAERRALLPQLLEWAERVAESG